MGNNSRYSTIVVNASVPRAAIGVSRHGQVDLSLKDFRIVARRAQAFSLPFAYELQILERIYYKGKNQHRSALFWRKVVEVRRLGARISGLNVSDLVENLRYAFYAKEDRTNPKSLRGSWKQSPDEITCVSLLKWIRSACLLVDEARERFRSAHQAFLQQIRHATFMPLAVSLAATTSRLDFLVTELRDILALQWQAVVRIQDNISVNGVNTNPNVQRPPNPFVSPTSSTSFKLDSGERISKRMKVSVDPTISEDLGSIITRDDQSVSESQEVSTKVNSSSFTGLDADHPSSLSTSSFPETEETLIPPLAPLPTELSVVKLPVHHSELRKSNSTQPATKKPKSTKVRATQRRDVIDDIFGF